MVLHILHRLRMTTKIVAYTMSSSMQWIDKGKVGNLKLTLRETCKILRMVSKEELAGEQGSKVGIEEGPVQSIPPVKTALFKGDLNLIDGIPLPESGSENVGVELDGPYVQVTFLNHFIYICVPCVWPFVSVQVGLICKLPPVFGHAQCFSKICLLRGKKKMIPNIFIAQKGFYVLAYLLSCS